MRKNGMTVMQLPDPIPMSEHQVAFVPIPGQGQTAVYVPILGVPVLPWGAVGASELPRGQYGERHAAVLVREGQDGLTVVDTKDIIMDPVAAAAREAAEGLNDI